MTLLLEATGRAAVLAHAHDPEPLWRPPETSAPPEPSRTLDDVLSEAWSGLLAGATAACPVCHAEMTPSWSAGAGVVGGRCGNCGSALA